MTVGMTALKAMTDTAGNARGQVYSAVKSLQAYLKFVYQVMHGSLYAMTHVAKGAQELHFGKIDAMLPCYKGCMYRGPHFAWRVLQVQMTYIHTWYGQSAYTKAL